MKQRFLGIILIFSLLVIAVLGFRLLHQSNGHHFTSCLAEITQGRRCFNETGWGWLVFHLQALGFFSKAVFVLSVSVMMAAWLLIRLKIEFLARVKFQLISINDCRRRFLILCREWIRKHQDRWHYILYRQPYLRQIIICDHRPTRVSA